MCMNPCRVRQDDYQTKAIAVLDAQRMARGIRVSGEPSFCLECIHLQALSDRIRELSQRLSQLENSRPVVR